MSGRAVRSGRIEGISDNVAQRITFVPITAVSGKPVALLLEADGPGEARLWLCGRAPGTGALTVRDHMVDGSLVLTTLHLAVPTDSLRPALAVDTPPAPEPGTLLAGACAVTQSFRWPTEPTAHGQIGLRLAMGGRTALGRMAYEVRDEETGDVGHRDSLGVAGAGTDDYVWMALGGPYSGKQLTVTVSGVAAQAEMAVRFWWMPGNLYGWGEATGCVPRPGGDFRFQLAKAYPAGEWVGEFSRLAAELAPEVGRRTLDCLLGARLFVAGIVALLACSMRRAAGSDPKRR
ncbi:MAG: hypothetical protein MUE60_16635 [Candidatus Eisenbacteria bacterium]|nr:hypothetical protein [Candidatus Eisenbacteria bacterium]